MRGVRQRSESVTSEEALAASASRSSGSQSSVAPPALVVEGLSRRFGAIKAVDDISFEVSEGSVFGIIGPNGAGKTTTFNLVSGDEQADSGEIMLFGERVTRRSGSYRARQGLGRTFQIPQPLGDLSVRENVLIGALLRHPLRSAKSRADEILDSLDLVALADVQTDRLNTLDGKRLELARALATDPRILLLDEPVAGLTEGELSEALALLRTVAGMGITLVIIEHVLRAVFSMCAQIVVLNFGSVVTIGPPAEIRSDPRVIEAYLGVGDD